MATYSGTDSADTYTGTSGDDAIFGNGGNDILDGAGGNDLLVGGPGADILTGGTGVDTFRGTAADMNGDHITDFLIGDRIQFLDLTLADAQSFSTQGNTLYYTGGSLQIDNLGPGRFVLREISGGGLEIRLQAASHNDFNGDGFSDVLWRSDNGSFAEWSGATNGVFTDNSSAITLSLPTSWKMAGSGDFNGDGRVDVLWRNDNGAVIQWLAKSTGGFTDNSANFNVNPGLGWKIGGVGDFNGDGRADVLWRNDGGQLTEWLGSASGGFTDNSTYVNVNTGPGWSVASTGDFNGDGLDDVLWRNTNGRAIEWLGTTTGAFTDNSANFDVNPGTGWHVVATGDYNGDGRHDIIWRNDGGVTAEWLGAATGGFIDNSANFSVNPGTGWHVVSTGDYNGDAIDDVLWRNDGGLTLEWLGQANGGFIDNSALFRVDTGAGWHIQDPFVHDPFL